MLRFRPPFQLDGFTDSNAPQPTERLTRLQFCFDLMSTAVWISESLVVFEAVLHAAVDGQDETQVKLVFLKPEHNFAVSLQLFACDS